MPAEELSATIQSGDSCALRSAVRRDAPEIEQLVRRSGVLDSNSCYAYLLLCDHFRDTCRVAEHATGSRNGHGTIAGFVAAYIPPNKPDAIFVWQIGVARWAQRRGLGKRLLSDLIDAPACRNVRYLEATVTDSNVASRRLFTAFAEEMWADIQWLEGYSSCDFGDDDREGCHEAERLCLIGPFPQRSSIYEEA